LFPLNISSSTTPDQKKIALTPGYHLGAGDVPFLHSSPLNSELPELSIETDASKRIEQLSTLRHFNASSKRKLIMTESVACSRYPHITVHEKLFFIRETMLVDWSTKPQFFHKQQHYEQYQQQG
jgi:hypothetical protein